MPGGANGCNAAVARGESARTAHFFFYYYELDLFVRGGVAPNFPLVWMCPGIYHFYFFCFCFYYYDYCCCCCCCCCC